MHPKVLNAYKSRSVKAKIGTIIIVIAFVLSANPYFLVFAVPFLLIGLLFTWISGMSISRKLFWTVSPILLWYPAVLTFMYISGVIGKWNAQKLDFIFPEGFQGSVIISSKIPCGLPVMVTNGREQIAVPSSGIVLYQGKIESGFIDHRYFQIIGGDQKLVRELDDYMWWEESKEKPPTNLPGVFLGSSGTRYVGTQEPAFEYNILALTLSSKDSLANFHRFQYTQRMENLADSLINLCLRKGTKKQPK